MAKKTFLVIGGVAAGMSAASRIRTLDTDAHIQVFQKSNYVSYISCGIPYLIEGKVPSSSKLVAYDASFFKEKRNIDVQLNHEVVKISPSNKTVSVRYATTGDEREYSYDRLLISTGARPVVPTIKGIDLKGIYSIRLLEDGIAIQDYMANKSPKRGLIIGAGNIGMEMAEAFSERGLSVTVVEKMPNILGSMDDEINEVVEEELKNKKVALIKSKGVVEFVGDSSGVKRAILDDGDSIDTDIVITGTGIKPNAEIAREAGIELGRTGAIKVNDHMETNLPDIFSAGDCAEAYHLILNRSVYMPLGTTANKQGRVAGENMAGGKARFGGVVGTSVFKVFGLEVGRTGLTEKDAKREGRDYIANVIEQFSRAHYYPGVTQIRVKLIADKKTGQILGAQMVGREGVSKRLDVFATALITKMTVREVANLDLGYAPPFAPVYDPILIAGSELLKKIENFPIGG
jgi:NADPH-dependent 2,4-dienoyl-CoA reductase/sulfur reductase-like enzyme